MKVRARALRFMEEVQLLQEEQRRVLKSLERDALEWERRAAVGANKECLILRQGAVAYASRQRQLMIALQTRFRQLWTGVGLANGLDRAAEAAELGDGARLYRIESDDEDAPMNLLKDDDSDGDL